MPPAELLWQSAFRAEIGCGRLILLRLMKIIVKWKFSLIPAVYELRNIDRKGIFYALGD
jgi:hypothetical protein